MAMPLWEVPEGLAVRADGSWRVGGQHVIHPPTLRYLKAHLVFEPAGAFVVDGTQRMAVALLAARFENLPERRRLDDAHANEYPQNHQQHAQQERHSPAPRSELVARHRAEAQYGQVCQEQARRHAELRP